MTSFDLTFKMYLLTLKYSHLVHQVNSLEYKKMYGEQESLCTKDFAVVFTLAWPAMAVKIPCDYNDAANVRLLFTDSELLVCMYFFLFFFSFHALTIIIISQQRTTNSATTIIIVIIIITSRQFHSPLYNFTAPFLQVLRIGTCE